MNNAEIIVKGQKYCLNVFNRLPIAMVRGEGSYVFDADGNKYLDFVGGIAVNAPGGGKGVGGAGGQAYSCLQSLLAGAAGAAGRGFGRKFSF